MALAERLKWILSRALTPIMLVMAFALFFAGVAAPFFNVQKLWLFHDSVSVLTGLAELAGENEWFLFVIIFLFTLVFPVTKLSVLAAVWYQRGTHDERADKLLRWASHLGKWSMLDVFVVAILVVTVKAAALAKITVEPGVWLFTASVVLTQITALRLEQRLRRPA